MILMGFFSRTPSAEAVLKKHGPRVMNKRAQSHDRSESIQLLAQQATPEAIAALMQRFNIRVDPSITDQQEKEQTFQGIVGAGEVAIQPVRAYLARAESLAWPLKILGALLSEEAVTDELLSLLSDMDTEYERDPQRKYQVLLSLNDRSDGRIAQAVVPFVQDVNETARFHAVSTVLAQDNASEVKDALLDAFVQEESVRVRAGILDGFAKNAWSIGTRADEVKGKLPGGFTITKKGDIHKR